MKKVIGILGVAVIAMTMFFNTNIKNNSTGYFNLASIVDINTANAEGVNCFYYIVYHAMPDGGYYRTCNFGGTSCC